MKAIQITMDEALLEALDATSDVQERGRSAVLREAAVAYLESLSGEEILIEAPTLPDYAVMIKK